MRNRQTQQRLGSTSHSEKSARIKVVCAMQGWTNSLAYSGNFQKINSSLKKLGRKQIEV